ncbi:unnamed protein product [Camellia sinensis]
MARLLMNRARLLMARLLRVRARLLRAQLLRARYLYPCISFGQPIYTLIQCLLHRSALSIPLFQPQIGFYLHTYLSLRGGYTQYHVQVTSWRTP